jgi:hypothetical protein
MLAKEMTMMEAQQQKPFLQWLEDQLMNLHRWARELRVSDPARFHHQIEEIEAHRDWLEGQIRQLRSQSPSSGQSF